MVHQFQELVSAIKIYILFAPACAVVSEVLGRWQGLRSTLALRLFAKGT